MSQSADFHFWLALLQTLLPQVEQLASSRRDEQSLADAVGWVLGLMGCIAGGLPWMPCCCTAHESMAVC